jgi:hypothetical protein
MIATPIHNDREQDIIPGISNDLHASKIANNTLFAGRGRRKTGLLNARY